MRGYFESLESRLLLSSVSDALASDRAQLAADMAKFSPTLSADRNAVAADVAMRASADRSVIAQLKTDLATLAGRFRADRQSLLTTRAADLMSLRADRTNPDALVADRLKLQADMANAMAMLKQFRTDRASMLTQGRAAIAASHAAADVLLKPALAKLASDTAIAAPIITSDLMRLRNDMAELLAPVMPMAGMSGNVVSTPVNTGGGTMGSGGMGSPSAGTDPAGMGMGVGMGMGMGGSAGSTTMTGGMLAGSNG